MVVWSSPHCSYITWEWSRWTHERTRLSRDGERFGSRVEIKVSAVADKNAGLVKIDRKSVEWHCGLIAIPVLEVNSLGVDGLENR